MEKKKESGILTKRDIIKEKIIINGDLSLINESNCDLTLGRVYLLLERDKCIKKLSKGGRLVIKPFSSVLITTEETVKLPSNIVGRFGLRIKFAIEGLILQVGPQIEPCSNTKLIGMLTNFSGNTIVLHQGENILTAEFEYIKEVEKKPESEENDIEKYIMTCCDNNDFISLGKQLSRYSIDSVNSQNKFLSTMLWAIPLVFAIIMPLVTVIITKFTYDKGSCPTSVLVEKEQEFNSLKKEIQSLKLELSNFKKKSDHSEK